MPVKAVLDAIDGVDEALRPLYVEVADEKSPLKGKFMLDVEGVNGIVLEDVTALKNALTRVKDEKESLAETIKRFEGIDPGKARSAMKRLEELEAFDPEAEADKRAKVKAESQIAKITDEHNAAITEAQARINALLGNVRQLTAGQEIAKAIADAKGLPGLDAIASRFVKTVEKGGKFVTVVTDATGAERVNNRAEPMTVAELMSDLKVTYPHLFAGTEQSGTGAPPTGGKPPNSGNLKRSTMNPVDKAKFIKEHGQEAYFKLPM